MNQPIDTLKTTVIQASQNPTFMHHAWYVEWHLAIVETLAQELCTIYQDADKELVLALVWIHDYGKILDRNNEHALNAHSEELLLRCGFEKDKIATIIHYLTLMEQKMEIDLRTTPIEVQIVSSADAAAHMVGPFFPIYWKEFSNKSIPELLEDNKRKLQKDWERKITLPEVHAAFKSRHEFLQEQTGILPKTFF